MKTLWKLAMMAVCVFTLAACSDDDNNTPPPGGGDTENDNNGTTNNTTGVYILSQGNIYNGIDGALTYYNPQNSDNIKSLFAEVNGRDLKGTPNDGLVYGTKLYLACTDENLIEVADAATAQSIKQIQLSGVRRLLAEGGYLYATSFYDNCVAKIDTADMEVVATIETGAYPEGMAVLNGKLYVANSGYGRGNTVSVIDLATFTQQEALDVPTNPVDLYNCDGTLYLRCSGEYNSDIFTYEVNPALYMLHDGTSTYIADATISAAGKDYIYFIDDNYYKDGTTYGRVKISDHSIEPLHLDHGGVPHPFAIAEDPGTGDIYITSYNDVVYDGDIHAADYNSDGYCVRFDKNGRHLDQFPVGVSAGAIIFF